MNDSNTSVSPLFLPKAPLGAGTPFPLTLPRPGRYYIKYESEKSNNEPVILEGSIRITHDLKPATREVSWAISMSELNDVVGIYDKLTRTIAPSIETNKHTLDALERFLDCSILEEIIHDGTFQPPIDLFEHIREKYNLRKLKGGSNSDKFRNWEDSKLCHELTEKAGYADPCNPVGEVLRTSTHILVEVYRNSLKELDKSLMLFIKGDHLDEATDNSAFVSSARIAALTVRHFEKLIACDQDDIRARRLLIEAVLHGSIQPHPLNTLAASGDLYHFPHSGTTRDPQAFKSINCFAPENYSNHLGKATVNANQPGPGHFSIDFPVSYLDRNTKRFLPSRHCRFIFRPIMKPKDDTYEGVAMAKGGKRLGTIQMIRTSDEFLREAEVSIRLTGDFKNITNQTDLPRDNKNIVRKMRGAVEQAVKDMMSQVDWNITFPQHANAEEDSRSEFSITELHDLIRSEAPPTPPNIDPRFWEQQPSTAPSNGWRYELLVVPRIHEYQRGVMFDIGEYDKNKAPREAAAIAAEYQFPSGLMDVVFEGMSDEFDENVGPNQIRIRLSDDGTKFEKISINGKKGTSIPTKENRLRDALKDKFAALHATFHRQIQGDPEATTTKKSGLFLRHVIRQLATVDTKAPTLTEQKIFSNTQGEYLPEPVLEAALEGDDEQMEHQEALKDCLFLRTLMHEFGHLLGLPHNHSSMGFMNTTDVLAKNAPAKLAIRDSRAIAESARLLESLLRLDTRELKITASPDVPSLPHKNLLILSCDDSQKFFGTINSLNQYQISLMSYDESGEKEVIWTATDTEDNAAHLSGLRQILHEYEWKTASLPSAATTVIRAYLSLLVLKEKDPIRAEAIKNLADELHQRNLDFEHAHGKTSLFPHNVKYEFDSAEQDILQHGPDISLRPGHNVSLPQPLSDSKPREVKADGLALEVIPIEEAQIFGAPVRLNLRLKNLTISHDTPRTLYVPPSFSMEEGNISGWVVGPMGRRVSFAPMAILADQIAAPIALPPGGEIWRGLTLIRGIDASLFPYPGTYQIGVSLRWYSAPTAYHSDRPPMRFEISGETRITVLPPTSHHHAQVAQAILENEETLRLIALRASTQRALEAIESAESIPTLHQHYSVIRAKAHFDRFLNPKPEGLEDQTEWEYRLANLYKAREAVNSDSKMTVSEAAEIDEILSVAAVLDQA